jgi:HK97 family phage portal protein
MPDGQAEVIPHPVINLLSAPTPGVPPSLVWSWVITDYQLLGNAYLRKVRVNEGVVALQYLPADMVRPNGNKFNSLTDYIYTVDGTAYNIRLDDIIHFRYHRDPLDLRLGRSPVVSVLREISTDNQAASTAYGLLRNNAMPSMIIGPDSKGETVDISPDDARQTKLKIQQDFSGDSAGSVVVMSGAYKMDRVSLTPSELALDDIRRKPEERICAAIGLNPLVLQLGSGLERSTYSNLATATRSAWTDGMIPLQRQMAEALTLALLPEYPETQDGDYLQFHVGDVPALQEDLNEDAQRSERLYKAGIIDLSTAKRIAGVTPTDNDLGYYHPSSVPIQIDAGVPNGLPVTVREETKSLDEDESGLKFYPNKSMIEEAKRAIAWRDAGRDGGTAVAWARANQIINGEKLSESTVLRMYSFFRRHEVDKQAEGFSPGGEGYPSPGRVAWSAWGGDAGYDWATRSRSEILKRMAPKENGKSYHPYYGYELTDADG